MDIYKTHINKNASEKQLVFTGRLVAFIALLIAVLVAKPLLSSLDQAFQYIQEYTGYIYPGVVVVFGMGLFWKQATARAALWTAIITIPAGVVIKMIFPEMPFILRMGYVFIILVFVATIISLLDKRKVDGILPDRKKSLGFVRTGQILIGISVICFILGIVYAKKLWHLGFDSIFMTATAFAFTGLIFILNARMKKVDPKSFEIKPELFETRLPFTIGAIGIVAIVASLYIMFW